MIESDGAFEISAVAGTPKTRLTLFRRSASTSSFSTSKCPGAGGLKLIPDIIEAAGGRG
jgi:hypothetical protein